MYKAEQKYKTQVDYNLHDKVSSADSTWYIIWWQDSSSTENWFNHKLPLDRMAIYN